MTPEKITVALLEASAAVTALVQTRIYPGGTTQAITPPALTYDVISDVPQLPISATAGENVYIARVQVSCIGRSYAESRDLGAAVRDAMHTKFGVVVGAKVVSCLLALRGPDFFEQDLGLYINPLDFSITYQE